EVRVQAAHVLVRLGPAELQAAIPVLIELLDEPNYNLRLRAAQILGTVGPLAKSAIPALVELLDDTQIVATIAGQALGQIGPEAVQAVLDSWLKEESVSRPGVIQALVQFGPAAKPALPKLMEALK